MVNSILEALVNVSEKAANIARAFRQDEHLFGLLVQEKSTEEGGNPRFVHDYKTLADVLIQEAIRHDIGLAVSVRMGGGGGGVIAGRNGGMFSAGLVRFPACFNREHER